MIATTVWTTVMSMDRIGIILVEKCKNDDVKIGTAFAKLFRPKVTIEIGAASVFRMKPSEFDLVIEQKSPIVKAGGYAVSIFEVTKDRRGVSGEIFSIVL